MSNRKYVLVAGILAIILSPGLWAGCNSNIVITKPNSIYIDNLDGTVTDIETGLMWQKCSIGQGWNPGVDLESGSDDSCDGQATTHNWHSALTIANGNTLEDYPNWRLPNKNELSSLVESACSNTSINTTLFPSTVGNYYWTSTPNFQISTYSWVIHFNIGFIDDFPKSDSYYVRLVRDSD